jgi:dienelactone hydrolase
MQGHDYIVQIPTDGERIEGTLVTPARQVPGVLFVHGWGGSRQQYMARARQVAELGCICLTFDLTGHAGTLEQFETVTRERNLSDVLGAYDTLVSQRMVDPACVAVVGSSYGGYLGSILTTLRPVRWLALRAPALYKDSGWELPKLQLHEAQDLSSYRRTFVSPQTNRALRACAAFGGDALVIESENDLVVPHAAVDSYVEAFKRSRSLTYRVIATADHGLSDVKHQQTYSTLLLNWLSEMISGAHIAGAASTPLPDADDVLPESAVPQHATSIPIYIKE